MEYTSVSYLVSVEWDGAKPQTTFYNRLHKLGIYVRGEVKGHGYQSPETPIARRSRRAPTGEDLQSVALNESTYMCASESLAKMIAAYATEFGARAVHVSIVETIPSLTSMSDADAKVMSQLESKLARRGRPPSKNDADDVGVCVTCREEASTYVIQYGGDDVVTCPNCKSPRINIIPGVLPTMVIPEGDLFEAWKRTRFSRGEFEVPPISGTFGTTPPEHVSIINQAESLTVKMMQASAKLIDEVNALARITDKQTAFEVLDFVLCGRTHTGPDTRRVGRITAVAALASSGVGDGEGMSIIESPTQFDILDAAYKTPTIAARWWRLAHKEMQKKSEPVPA